ncbi:FAD-binding protein, partial [Rhodococcus hoagii]|nr:FAD-binding protein [Prescottella equi]
MSLNALADALGSSRLVTDPDVMDAYTRDEAHLAVPGLPLAVLVADSTEDVAAALKWATEHKVPVVPRGAGSGLAGGATAIDGCLVVSTAAMRDIVELNPADQLAVVQAGVVNADLDRAAAEHGLMYAPDPSSFQISTIGGNIATNAGGLRCVKYGVTRDSVLGLEWCWPTAASSTPSPHRKGVAGYDLTGLLVGSEGTLGIVTGATVRLRPRPSREP